MSNRNKACSYPECSGRYHAKGFCKIHYLRWSRHGDPDKKLRAGNDEAARYIAEVVVPHADREACLTWPFPLTKCGNGRAVVDGRQELAHRIVCTLVQGPPPTPLHEAAHTCGKGHLGCVNPHHLRWKTRKENEADKLLHGTVVRGSRSVHAKLTEADVLTIRAVRGLVSQASLANRYNVTQGTISSILSGKNWAWL